MPAIVTHDTFGKEAHSSIRELIGSSPDCVHAFLLGNQGPDPLFYALADPSISEWASLGSRLHQRSTNEVLAAMAKSLSIIPKLDVEVAKAYALGFLCHYLLDVTVHPLVYAQQYALCDAGVPGLSRDHASAVHATIEREFDEVILNRHLNTNLGLFSPVQNILQGSKRVLKTASTMYLYTALVAFNEIPPSQLFAHSVKCFRGAQKLLYSPTGFVRKLFVKTEEAFRGMSSFGSLSMRTNTREESVFENNDHDTWIDPASGRERKECFENLYEAALDKVRDACMLFLSPSFSAEKAEHITQGLNFDGHPIGGAMVTVVS